MHACSATEEDDIDRSPATHLRAEEGDVGPQARARKQRVALRAHHEYQRLPADGHLRAQHMPTLTLWRQMRLIQ